MMNLVKAEFYKLRKMKPFYIVMMASAIWAVFLAFALQRAASMASLRPGDPDIQDIVKMQPNFGGAWFMGNSLNNGMFGLFVAILVSMFVTVEFSFGPMKNIVSRGFSRVQVYLAKFIASAAAGVMMLVVFLAAGCVAGTILWGFDPNGIAGFGNILRLFLDQGLLIISYAAVFVFVAMTLRSGGASIGVNICVVMLFTTLLQAVSLLFGGKIDLSSFWIAESVTRLATLSPVGSDVMRGVVVAVAYTVAATAGGCALFQKQDIK
jgi:ABC-2 type transport system permease protein